MSALIKADDLLAYVGSEPIVSSRASRNIHISMGVAVSTDHPSGDIDSLLNQADRGLYAAKQKGRNRVEHVEETTADVSANSTLPSNPRRQDSF
jgi:diguanylate cyclase (GGDEF)-like protein